MVGMDLSHGRQQTNAAAVVVRQDIDATLGPRRGVYRAVGFHAAVERHTSEPPGRLTGEDSTTYAGVGNQRAVPRDGSGNVVACGVRAGARSVSRAAFRRPRRAG